jgi:hypothetical protein
MNGNKLTSFMIMTMMVMQTNPTKDKPSNQSYTLHSLEDSIVVGASEGDEV